MLIINLIFLLKKETVERERGLGVTVAEDGGGQKEMMKMHIFKKCLITLEWAGGLLGQCQVILAQVVHGLVLVDLHAGAHIAVSMQEEREGARQVFSENDKDRCLS